MNGFGVDYWRLGTVLVVLVLAGAALFGASSIAVAGPDRIGVHSRAVQIAETPTRGSISAAPTATPTRSRLAPDPTATPTPRSLTDPDDGTCCDPEAPTPGPDSITGPTPPPTISASDNVSPGDLPQWDLQPVRIDLYQTINARFGTDDPAIPLIARKETLVRVYVQLTNSADPKIASVSVDLLRDGQPVSNCGGWGGEVEREIQPGAFDSQDIFWHAQRDNLARTANFVIPAECAATDPGTLTVRTSVSGYECCLDNNVGLSHFSFNAVRPLKIKPYLITYNNDDSPNDGKVPTPEFGGYQYLIDAFPISEVELLPASYLIATIDLEMYPGHDPAEGFGDWWTDLGEVMFDFKDQFGDDNADIQLGLFHSDITSCWGLANMPYVLTASGCGGTYAHEGGHAFGLPHASNDHGECEGGTCDEAWPYNHGGLIGNGWRAARPNKAIVPSGLLWHSHDTMSYGACDGIAPGYNDDIVTTYCANWLSPRNYATIAQRLACEDPQWDTQGTFWDPFHQFIWLECMVSNPPWTPLWIEGAGPPNSDQLALGAAPFSVGDTRLLVAVLGLLDPVPAVQVEPRLMTLLRVSGEISNDDIAELRPFYQVERLVVAEGADEGDGPYRLELLAADDRLLYARNFSPDPLLVHAPLRRSTFELYFPADPEIQRVRLWLGDRMLAERAASANQPRVSLLSPNGGDVWPRVGEVEIAWQADDADGDPLFFWLQYSRDGGQTWTTIRRNITDFSYRLDLTSVPGSGQALMRVQVSDGFRTAEDASDGPFTAADQPPQVGILRPLDATAAAGQSVTLRGLGSDYEDGALPDEALTWTSSLDGDLGRGAVLVRTLSPGEHVLTFAAIDSQGQVTNATTVLTVQ